MIPRLLSAESVIDGPVIDGPVIDGPVIDGPGRFSEGGALRGAVQSGIERTIRFFQGADSRAAVQSVAVQGDSLPVILGKPVFQGKAVPKVGLCGGLSSGSRGVFGGDFRRRGG